MIQTVDTNYAADCDTNHEKPIKSQKSPQIAYLTLKNFRIIGIGSADYSHRYWLQPIPLIICPITSITDVSVQLYSIVNVLLRIHLVRGRGDAEISTRNSALAGTWSSLLTIQNTNNTILHYNPVVKVHKNLI